MILDINIFAENFYNTTYIPISIFNCIDNHTKSYPSGNDYQTMFKTIIPGLRNFTKSPDYFVTDSFCYYGYIQPKIGDYRIILGPVFSTPVSKAMLHDFMTEWAINPAHKEDVFQFLRQIPNHSLNQFLQILTYINYCINDEDVKVIDFMEEGHANQMKELSKKQYEQLSEFRENQRYHNSYSFERTFLQFIQDGEVDKIKNLFASVNTISEGMVADNSLRQVKNIFITTATLASRSAILGGLDIEEAYQLSDAYIMECEHSQSIPYISNLMYSMNIDYAERVSRKKIPAGMSKEVFDCVQFISKNVNQPIQVVDVANHIKRSRSYLAKIFKEELGFDVSSFIMRRKMEEAKSLLSYTDKSLSDISNYLCFSSQAYFQNVFKKKYGMTPLAYRKKTR